MRYITIMFICCLTLLVQPLFPARAETVALWLFDDPPGSPVAMDSSGNGYHLTIGQDAAIVAGGKFGNVLNADATPEDGLGAYRYKAEPALNPDDEDWTLECWVKARPDMQDDNRIWGLSGVNYIDYGRGENLVSLQVASRFLPIDGALGWNKPTGNLKADGQYHHLAVVYDSKAKQLQHYFDGQLQFTAQGLWKAVETGEPPYADVVFPPHYPMLQVGMRDAIQQWDHRELHARKRYMKKFEGYIDEMRFSNAALYSGNFVPPSSFAQPYLHLWPEQLSFVVIRDEGLIAEQTLTVSAGQFTIDFSIRESIPWLSLDRSKGTANSSAQIVQAKVDATDLPNGRYTAVIEFESPGAVNSPLKVPIYLTVTGKGQIRDAGDRKQLFIDERFIERSENVQLRLNQPEKVDIVFEATDEKPLYPCNIIFDEQTQVYRMYYSEWNRSRLSYAESSDGINWKKPGPGSRQIGIITDEASGDALKPLAFGATVMLDPVDIPKRRYKAFQERRFQDNPKRNGVYAYYSSDGFHFREQGRVTSILPETGYYPYWDERIQKYVVYMRVMNSKKGLKMIQGNQFFYRPGFTYDNPEGYLDVVEPESMFKAGYENIRSIGRIETDNLLKPWPIIKDAPRTIYTTPNHVPMVLAADKWDGFTDFYTGMVEMYPYAQDVYLMFITPFRHFHPSRQPWFYRFDDANGPIGVQLAVSRDGIHWRRADRSAYIDTGLTDEWDRWLIMIGRGMVVRGNYIYQYYWGTGRLHDSIYLRPELAEQKLSQNPSGTSLGAVRQRLDGFISADVDYRGGAITTPPIVFSGNRLKLNHNCGASGTIFVELRDLNDQPIPGYTLADCEEITGNDVAWEVRWQGSGDLSPLAGKPVKLYFKMRSTKLYAFQFVSQQIRSFSHNYLTKPAARLSISDSFTKNVKKQGEQI